MFPSVQISIRNFLTRGLV